MTGDQIEFLRFLIETAVPGRWETWMFTAAGIPTHIGQLAAEASNKVPKLLEERAVLLETLKVLQRYGVTSQTENDISVAIAKVEAP